MSFKNNTKMRNGLGFILALPLSIAILSRTDLAMIEKTIISVFITAIITYVVGAICKEITLLHYRLLDLLKSTVTCLKVLQAFPKDKLNTREFRNVIGSGTMYSIRQLIKLKHLPANKINSRYYFNKEELLTCLRKIDFSILSEFGRPYKNNIISQSKP